MRKSAQPDIQKVFDENLVRTPYLNATFHIALSDLSEEVYTKAEAKAFLDKHYLDFTEIQYAHYFK